jgi:hypothetical protein
MQGYHASSFIPEKGSLARNYKVLKIPATYNEILPRAKRADCAQVPPSEVLLCEIHTMRPPQRGTCVKFESTSTSTLFNCGFTKSRDIIGCGSASPAGPVKFHKNLHM